MTERLAPDEIAALARITVKHMRRVISQFSAGPWHGRTAWRGLAHPSRSAGRVFQPARRSARRCLGGARSDGVAAALPGPQYSGTAARRSLL